MRAYIVVDLGFGDSGKGLVTDFLVRQFRSGLVVRYNGGAQAGHNVVTPDGRHHTFSQFGSGTFVPHVKTYLARHVVIHPTALLVEGDLLERKGIENPFSNLRVSDQALVITPYHQAANRIREMARGMHRHGSCGVGVGEAVEDALLHAETRVLAGDLKNTKLLRRKLESIRARKCEQMIAFCKESSITLQTQEFEIFEREDVIDRWIALISRMNELDLIVPDKVLDRWLHETDSVVFEGAQGVLLDAEAGFHPYTTWSDCTAANAFELIREAAPDSDVLQIGVMRSYAIRHGPGPLPTETNMLSSIVSEHNQYNPWQGAVRYGWFDAVLARYALDIIKGVDSLVVTHMDAWPHLKTWNYCQGYKDNQELDHNTAIDPIRYGDLLTSFRLPPSLSLEQRAQFTQALSTVTPALEVCEADDETIIRKIESLIGQQVGMISHGPSSTNVQRFNSFPS